MEHVPLLSQDVKRVQQTSPLEEPIDKFFPEEAANSLATLESYNKHLYRPNSYLHKWWARRSGVTFRYILKQLISDHIKRDYYKSGGLEGKIVFDPMMGGGTTLHEAIRMGANVIGIDIDPIPVLQTKATLALLSLEEKQTIFKDFFEKLNNELAHFYKTTCSSCGNNAEIQFVLYGLRKRCACAEVLFMDKLVLRQETQREIRICPMCRTVYTDKTLHICNAKLDIPLKTKGTRRCEKCNSTYTDILDQPFYERYIPLVIVGLCPEHGQFFKEVSSKDLDLLVRANHVAREINFGTSEHFDIIDGPKSKDLLRRKISTFKELFAPRQLLYISIAQKLLAELPAQHRLWMALLLSTSLEFNCLLCGYKGADIRRPGAIRHVFSHHAYSFPYTALENNPIFSGNTSGTLHRIFGDRILRAGRWAITPVETLISDNKKAKFSVHGEIDGGEMVTDWQMLTTGTRKFLVLQRDSASLDIPSAFADYVVTDPPYFDSVQYSDLSQFFRVWLRLFLPHDADWRYNPVASAVSEGSISSSKKYSEILEKIWKICNRVLKKEHGRLIFTFHHWNYEAWAALTISLKKANLLLVNRYIVHSENPISVHIRGLKALKHDTILVLKPNVIDKPFKWKRTSKVNKTDSYTFCQDCGTVLGWLLSSDLDESYIYAEWKRLLGGNDNGKAPS